MTLSDKLLEQFEILEIFLPSKDDYDNKTNVDSYKKSIQQKQNWKKYRHRYMTGIDKNARNNYKQGLYDKDKTLNKDVYKSNQYEV